MRTNKLRIWIMSAIVWSALAAESYGLICRAGFLSYDARFDSLIVFGAGMLATWEFFSLILALFIAVAATVDGKSADDYRKTLAANPPRPARFITYALEVAFVISLGASGFIKTAIFVSASWLLSLAFEAIAREASKKSLVAPTPEAGK